MLFATKCKPVTDLREAGYLGQAFWWGTFSRPNPQLPSWFALETVQLLCYNLSWLNFGRLFALWHLKYTGNLLARGTGSGGHRKRRETRTTGRGSTGRHQLTPLALVFVCPELFGHRALQLDPLRHTCFHLNSPPPDAVTSIKYTWHHFHSAPTQLAPSSHPQVTHPATWALAWPSLAVTWCCFYFQFNSYIHIYLDRRRNILTTIVE